MRTRQFFNCLMFLFFTNTILAQFVVNNGISPTQLVQDYLVGNGVTVTNVTVNTGSDSRQFGHFTNANSNLPIGNGIVMMTGYSDDLNNISTNIDGSFSSINSNPSQNCPGGICGPGDVDLNTLLFPDNSYDAAVIEFDFIPLSDTIRFRYVFASEEYNEYVCSDFNDIFAFFISGPGFAVPTNLAIIPNTNPPLPVSINNINNGNIGTMGNTSNCMAAQLSNSGYFIDNINGLHVQFDGMTVALEAWAVVQPCSTYHIKLAIADAFDGSLDSGIFLEAGSFSSSGMVVESVTAHGDSVITEQCNTGQINFMFDNPPLNDTTFFFTIGGTAINGVDYQLIADSINVQAGDSIATLDIIPISDGLVELLESIILMIPTNICSADTVILYIGEENAPEAPDSLHCYTIQDSIVAFGWASVPGATNYQISLDSGISWISPNNGQFEHHIGSVPFNTPVGLWVGSVDSNLICTMSSFDSLVCMNCGLDVNIDNIIPTCQNSNEGAVSLSITSGTAPFSYLWNNGISSLNFTNANPGNYSLSITDANGCMTVLPSLIINNLGQIPDLAIDSIVTTLSCDLLPIGNLNAIAIAGTAPLSYIWNNGVSTASNNYLAAGSYSVTVNDGPCFSVDSCTIIAPDVPDLNAYIGAPLIIDSTIYLSESILIDANNTTSGSFNFLWVEVNSNSNANIDNPTASSTTVEPSDTGVYAFLVTAFGNNNGVICVDSGFVTLRVMEEVFLGIPNAFSPNNDGVNDYFKPVQLNPAYIIQFQVFNRWGQSVYNYEENSDVLGWDGTYNYTPQARDVYLYLLSYQLPGQEINIFRGEVTLMR